MTDEDKTGSQESGEEPTAPLVLAAIGSVLLFSLGVLTFVVGLLSPLLTGGCGPESESGTPEHCRHTTTVARMLTVPVLLILPAGLLFTWFRLTPPYRPRVWVPLVGVALIGALRLAANSLLKGRLF